VLAEKWAVRQEAGSTSLIVSRQAALEAPDEDLPACVRFWHLTTEAFMTGQIVNIDGGIDTSKLLEIALNLILQYFPSERLGQTTAI